VTLVLASGSASRARLLTEAGVAFVQDPAGIDEAAFMRPDETAPSVARTLAEEKAKFVSRRHPGKLVLGGDSVLDFAGELISKCPDRNAARALLSRLSGKAHAIVSAAALARDGDVVWRHVGEGRLFMRELSPDFLDAYLEAECPAILASVGCYHLEGRGAQLFARIEGDYFSILGLPLLAVLAGLREQGALKT
jgi:septum formation protein